MSKKERARVAVVEVDGFFGIIGRMLNFIFIDMVGGDSTAAAAPSIREAGRMQRKLVQEVKRHGKVIYKGKPPNRG